MNQEMETRNNGYTRKQMSDACEMLVAAELTLAGMPALKMPDNWPGYDVIAQPVGTAMPQRISVKSRTFKPGPAYVDYKEGDSFDWLAIVICRDMMRCHFQTIVTMIRSIAFVSSSDGCRTMRIKIRCCVRRSSSHVPIWVFPRCTSTGRAGTEFSIRSGTFVVPSQQACELLREHVGNALALSSMSTAMPRFESSRPSHSEMPGI